MPFRPAVLAAGVVVGVLAGATGSPFAAASVQGEPVPAPSAAFVADSIGWYATDEVTVEVQRTRRLPTVITGPGASIDDVLPAVREALAAPDAPTIWVVALGHAHVALGAPRTEDRLRRDIRAMLDLLSPQVDCIRWLDIIERPSFYPQLTALAPAFNRALWQVATTYENVEVYHYRSWAAQPPGDSFIPDGLHHTQQGEWDFARMVRQAADGCDPDTNSGPYWDVPNADPAAGAIAWIGHRQLMDGFPNDTFRAVIASSTVRASRGTVANAIWHREGRPHGYGTPQWRDVPPHLNGALAWVSALRLAQGFPPDRYRPGAHATRAHVVRFLWSAAGRPSLPTSQPWTDPPADLRPALRWLTAAGYRQVFPGDEFDPARPITRGEFARLLAPPGVPRPGPSPASGPRPIEPEIMLVGDAVDPTASPP